MADEKTPQAAPPAPQAPRNDAETEALRGQVAFLTSEKARLETELAAAKDTQKFDAAVTARADALIAARDARKALEAQVTAACPDVKCDGKSDLEVRTDAVRMLRPELKLDGRSADYVSAVFDMAIQGLQEARADQARVQGATPHPGNVRDESRRDDAIGNAQQRNSYEQSNAWRGADWLKDHPFKAN